jgi:hypothetical protein
VRGIPVSLRDIFAINLRHCRTAVTGPVVIVQAEQNKGRNDQQKEQPHRDFGVLANEIKHLKSPVTAKDCAQSKCRDEPKSNPQLCLRRRSCGSARNNIDGALQQREKKGLTSL